MQTTKSHGHLSKRWLMVGATALAGVATLAASVLGMGAQAVNAEGEDSWGPTDRETFTWQNPSTFVTFNSITDNPVIGDERNFVRVREAGTGTYGDSVDLEVGKTYEVYIYVHNNSSANLNSSGEGLAENVTLSTALPEKIEDGQSGIVEATISATNATPSSVWDTAYFTNKSGKTIYLRYVHDSAVITNDGSASGSILDANSLFSENGAFLAYSSNYWGIIPGCNEYAGYVTYQVVADSPEFSATKEVSVAGEDNFADNVTVNPGATLDFTIDYANSGTTEQTSVTVYDTLPEGLTFVPGSVVVTRDDGTVVELENGDLLFSDGIVIGDYAAGQSATIAYQATLADADSFECGNSELLNQSLVATANGEITDKTKITVNRVCENTPESIPDTGPAEIALLIVIIAAIGGGTAYYIHTRKALNSAKAAAGGMGSAGASHSLNGSSQADQVNTSTDHDNHASTSGMTPDNGSQGSVNGATPDSSHGTTMTETTSGNDAQNAGMHNPHNASNVHQNGGITGLSSENFGQDNHQSQA